MHNFLRSYCFWVITERQNSEQAVTVTLHVYELFELPERRISTQLLQIVLS